MKKRTDEGPILRSTLKGAAAGAALSTLGTGQPFTGAAAGALGGAIHGSIKTAGNAIKKAAPKVANAASSAATKVRDMIGSKSPQKRSSNGRFSESFMLEDTTASSVGAFPIDFQGGPSSVKVVKTNDLEFKIVLTDSGEEIDIETGLPEADAEKLADEYRSMFASGGSYNEEYNMYSRKNEGPVWNKFKKVGNNINKYALNHPIKSHAAVGAVGGALGGMSLGPVGSAAGALAGAGVGAVRGAIASINPKNISARYRMNKSDAALHKIRSDAAKKAARTRKMHGEGIDFDGENTMLSTNKLIESIARGANVREAVGSYLSSRLLEDEDIATILSPVDTAPGTTLPGVDVEDPEDDAATEAEVGPTDGIVPDADEFPVDASVSGDELATKDVDDEEMASVANGAPSVPGEFMEARERFRIRKGVRESLRKMGLLKEADDDLPPELTGEDTPEQEEEPIEEPKFESGRRPSLRERLIAASRRSKKESYGDDEDEFGDGDEDDFGGEGDGDEDDETFGESTRRRRRKISEDEFGDGSGIAAADRLPGEEMPTSGDDEDNENEGATPTTPGVAAEAARRRLRAKLEAFRKRRALALKEEEAGMNFPPDKEKEDGEEEEEPAPEQKETHIHIHTDENKKGRRRVVKEEEGDDEEDSEEEFDYSSVEEPEEPMESRNSKRFRPRIKESKRIPSVLNESLDNQYQLGETVNWQGKTGTIVAQNPSALGYFYLVQLKNGPSVQAAQHELTRS